MERKTARISKEPEARRQEILDTTMSVFMEKGYEAATMRDIAVTIHVVPGLCYRYLESKQILRDTAIEQYVKDTTHPMIERLKEKDDLLDGFPDKMEQLFIQTDEKEEYHHFFHKKGNHDLRILMSVKLCETTEPYMEEKSRKMNENGITRAGNIPLTAPYMLFDTVPALENDGLLMVKKALGIHMIMKCILEAQARLEW